MDFMLVVVISICATVLNFVLNDLLQLICFENYSEMVTFLSIVTGFYLTTISILFNSKLLKLLYEVRKNKKYQSSLHQLKYYFQSSFYINITSIIILIIFPKELYLYIVFQKSWLIIPLLSINIFAMIRIANLLFYFFSLPRNE